MNRKNFYQLAIGLVFLGTALTLWAWPNQTKTTTDEVRVRSTTIVKTDAVKVTEEQRVVRFSGVTRAGRRAVLSFSVPARLIERSVEVGDRVDKGKEIARLDSGEFKNAEDTADAALSELEIRIAQAARDKNRIERLAAAKAVTSEELEQATSAYDAIKAAHRAATARLAEARRIISESTLKVPFSGTVTAVFVEPGEWTGPGQPVIELSGDGKLELKVEVPETVVAGLREGVEVFAELPFAGKGQIKGRIKSVARAASGPGRLFPVIVGLDNTHGISAGMTAELVLKVDAVPCLSIPLRAVINPGASQPAVFVVNNGIVRRVPIRIGRLTGDSVIVFGELSEGDRIVIEGHTMLSDGDLVEVAS